MRCLEQQPFWQSRQSSEKRFENTLGKAPVCTLKGFPDPTSQTALVQEPCSLLIAIQSKN